MNLKSNYNIDNLNIDPEKKEAIKSTEGPLLIIAGPGSGKTMTLVERIVYLVTKGINPESIFVATFTEKAAKELITRISNRLLELDLKVNLNEMYIGTLHSIFLRILEENREFTRLKRSYRLLDPFDQRYFIYNNIRAFKNIENADLLLGNRISSWQQASIVLDYVNKVGEEHLDLSKLIDSDDDRIVLIAKFFEVYFKLLEEENALDFSTIQYEAFELLSKNENVLSDIQDKLTHFMIDEYQDTNTIQEKIILLLSSKTKNICVVGDDDQGLYRFRGASIRNILEFKENFKKGECKQITLSTNYRSHPDIIDFYNKWMNKLDWKEGGKTFRFTKTIKPRNRVFTDNPSVIKVSNEHSLEDYYEEVYKFIIQLEKEGVLKNRNQIAFLFKSVKHQRVIGLAEYLENRGVQIFSPRSALFFEREEIQLLLGALIFLFPTLFEILKWNDNASLDIWDYFKHCKQKFANKIREDKQKNTALLQFCQTRAKEHLTLTANTTYGFAALIYQLLEYPMFSEYLDHDLRENKTNLRSAYNIALLTKLLWKFEYLNNISVLNPTNIEKHLTELFNKFFRFIHDGGIEEYEDFDEFTPADCVSFMTIHQSKGLEFPIVVVGMPNSRQGPRTQFTEIDSLLQNEFYEKSPFEPLEQTKYYDYWRLYYTAFSRPQNLLVLSCYEQKTKQGKYSSPNRNFQELYDKHIYWKDTKFDISKLELDEIKPTNIKHEYSFTSHILLYENCPLQYKFYKELEFTEVRTGGVLGGTLLHQTIEDIHKAVLKGEESKVTYENIENWFNTNYILLSKQMRAYLHKAQQLSLLKQVLKYKERQKNNWHLIKEAEVDVSLVKENFILKGTIDLIQGENNTVELIDFKSGDKPDVNSTDEHTRSLINRCRRQLEVYAHLVEERTGHTVSKMHLYYPKEDDGSPYVSFRKNELTINSTISSFEKIVNKIENKNFDDSHVKKCEKLCSSCDMRYYCNPRYYN
jgi:DNA helicase II / ATP-dependent DNA helicase PcrA